jgi:hypothetical protein
MQKIGFVKCGSCLACVLESALFEAIELSLGQLTKWREEVRTHPYRDFRNHTS